MSIVQAVVDSGERYAELVTEMHDALVLLARLEVEHTGVTAIAYLPQHADARRRVARRRILAHGLTLALRQIADFDERYSVHDRSEQTEAKTRKGERAS